MRTNSKKLIASLAILGASGAVSAQTLDCDAYRNYAGLEPVGYAEQCLGRSVDTSNAPKGVRAPTDTAFAHDIGFTSDNVVSFTLNNFPGQAVTGTSALPIFGYDYSPDLSTLYAIDTTANMFGTFTAAGVFTPIGTSTPQAGDAWSGMAVDPVTGDVYMTAVQCNVSSSLYSIDPATGAATLIGTDTNSLCTIAIAMNCDGDMYAHDIISDSIYQVDPATGVHTAVGLTGLAANFAQGMDFDNDDGQLYIFGYTGGGTNTFGTVNLATGSVTPLAVDNPLGEFEGATQTMCAPLDADLSLTKTATGGDALNSVVAFDLTVANNGPADANNVVVTDVLPGNVTYVGNNCGASEAGGTVTWNVGSLPNGLAAVCQITATVTGFGQIDNTATAVADENDPNPANNSSTASVRGVAAIIPTLGLWGLLAMIGVMIVGVSVMTRRD